MILLENYGIALSASLVRGKMFACIRSGRLHKPLSKVALDLLHHLLQPVEKSQQSSNCHHCLKNYVSLTACAYFGYIHPLRSKGPESHRKGRDVRICMNLHMRQESKGKSMYFRACLESMRLAQLLVYFLRAGLSFQN